MKNIPWNFIKLFLFFKDGENLNKREAETSQWIYEILQNTIQLPLYADLKRICETEGAKRIVDMKKQLLIFTNTNLLTNIWTELSCCSSTDTHQPKNYSFVIITSNRGRSRCKKSVQGTNVNKRWAAFPFSAQKPYS